MCYCHLPTCLAPRSNYQSTAQLLEAARLLPNVAGFVHVSTAFVNMSKPFMPGPRPSCAVGSWLAIRAQPRSLNQVKPATHKVTKNPRTSAGRQAARCHRSGLSLRFSKDSASANTGCTGTYNTCCMIYTICQVKHAPVSADPVSRADGTVLEQVYPLKFGEQPVSPGNCGEHGTCPQSPSQPCCML